jgi:hypothetical protein
MDHSSNRYLITPATPGEGALLTLNAFLKRSTPTLDLTLTPMLSVQRYTQNSGSDAANRSINAVLVWTHERSVWNLSGGYSDLSTLTTELASTGVVQGNTRQRQETSQGSWQFQHSERASLNALVSYTQVSYVGQDAKILTNYRIPSVSIGEKFNLWPNTSLTASANGSELSADRVGITRDYGLSLALEHAFSDRLSMVVSAGPSQESFKTQKTRGYVAEFRLTRKYERNNWSVSYQRSQVPNGFGGLVQRDQGSISVSRALSEHLNGVLSAFATRDHELFQLPSPSAEQGRNYETALAGLTWLSGETSSVGINVSTGRSGVQIGYPIPAAKSWQVGLTYTWTPLPLKASR